jgi:hypothetical protein
MSIWVTIDSCAWNYLFEKGFDLSKELPNDRFTLTIVREVEIEIEKIPDKGKDGSNKQPLKDYIANSIASNHVRTTSIFGFATHEPDGSLSKTQVYGPFGQGTFQSEDDRDFYASPEIKKLLRKPIRPSGLCENQADAAVAVRSFNSIVLTNEGKGKTGPLKFAKTKNGCVVYLKDFELSGESLADYLTNAAHSSI